MSHRILLVVLIVLSAAGCEKLKLGSSKSISPPVAQEMRVPLESRPVNESAVDDVARQNEFGIRHKALVTRANARCLDGPNGAVQGKPLALFERVFVHRFDPSEENPQSVLVGTSPYKTSEIGWLAKADFELWPTRLAAVPVRELLVYSRPEDLEQEISQGQSRAKPSARCTAWTPGHTPLPIAKTRRFEHAGIKHALIEVLFVGENRGDGSPHGTPAYSAVELAEIQAGVRHLDLIFVIDGTKSVELQINLIRQAMYEVMESLKLLDNAPELSVGIVLFRDYVREIMFDDGGAKSVTASPLGYELAPADAKLMGIISNITPATENSDEPAEAVYDGLFDSLTRTKFSHRLSHRVMVLVGDNSGHEPGHEKNPRNISHSQIVETAKKQRAKIFSLAVPNHHPDDVVRHRSQFERLAKETGGKFAALVDVRQVIDEIRKVVGAEIAKVDEKSAVVKELETRSPEELSADKRFRETNAVLELFSAERIDPAGMRRNVPIFASGWCRAEIDGRPCVNRFVLLTRNELDCLLGDLNFLCGSLSAANNSKTSGLIQYSLAPLVLNTAAGEASFFGRQRKETMEEFWRRCLGIRLTSGILALSQDELRSMSEADRARLENKVAREIIPRLQALRNDDRVFRFRDGIVEGFVPQEALP